MKNENTRRADRGQPDVMGGKDPACCLQPIIVKVEHAGAPRAAKLDVANTKAVLGLALNVWVRGDLVGESGEGPHG
jgi:hypothetical protein